MRRVTRSGGVVAAAVWDFRGGLVFQRLFWDTAAAIDPQAAATRDRLFAHPLAQPDGLVGLWQEIGLRDIDAWLADHTDGLPELRRLLGAAARRPGAVRLLRRGPAEPRRARIRAAVRARLPRRAPRTARARWPPPPGPCAGACPDAGASPYLGAQVMVPATSPGSCSTPPRYTFTVPATGLVMVRTSIAPPGGVGPSGRTAVRQRV